PRPTQPATRWGPTRRRTAPRPVPPGTMSRAGRPGTTQPAGRARPGAPTPAGHRPPAAPPASRSRRSWVSLRPHRPLVCQPAAHPPPPRGDSPRGPAGRLDARWVLWFTGGIPPVASVVGCEARPKWRASAFPPQSPTRWLVDLAVAVLKNSG